MPMLPLHLVVLFQWINRFSRRRIKVAYLIAKQGKPHIIGETLVKPAAMQLAKIMMGKEAENKLSLVPLSNDVLKSRINDIGKDILCQVVADLKAGLFFLFLFFISIFILLTRRKATEALYIG